MFSYQFPAQIFFLTTCIESPLVIVAFVWSLWPPLPTPLPLVFFFIFFLPVCPLQHHVQHHFHLFYLYFRSSISFVNLFSFFVSFFLFFFFLTFFSVLLFFSPFFFYFKKWATWRAVVSCFCVPFKSAVSRGEGWGCYMAL